MKKLTLTTIILSVASVLLLGALSFRALGAEAKDDAIKKVMKTYHKAPKGVDPICKKASDGKASAEEIKNLVAAYKTMTSATPPKGDAASWKEKTAKLLAATESLQKGDTDGVTKYKSAVNCKSCHSAHKTD